MNVLSNFFSLLERFQILVGFIAFGLSLLLATYYFTQNSKYSYHKFRYKDDVSLKEVTVVFDRSSGDTVILEQNFINEIVTQRLRQENNLNCKPHYFKTNQSILSK